MNRQAIATYALFFIVILTWSFNWPIMKVALQSMPDIWFAASRLMIASVITLLWCAMRGTLYWPKKRDLPLIFSLGFLQMGVYMTLVIVGLQMIGAGRTVILCYATMLWTIPIAVFVFKEKFSKQRLIGFALGLIGVFIYFNPTKFNWHDHRLVIGSGIALLSSFFWGIAILHARFGKWHVKPAQLFPWQLLAAMIPVTIAAFIIEPHAHFYFRLSLYETLFYSTLLATVFAWWGMIIVSKHLPSSTTSLGVLMVPVFAMVLADVLLHETITKSMVISLSAISLGIIFVATDKTIRQKTAK